MSFWREERLTVHAGGALSLGLAGDLTRETLKARAGALFTTTGQRQVSSRRCRAAAIRSAMAERIAAARHLLELTCRCPVVVKRAPARAFRVSLVRSPAKPRLSAPPA